MITKKIAEECTELLMRSTFGPFLTELQQETGAKLTAKAVCLVEGRSIAWAEYGSRQDSGAIGELRFVLTESFRAGVFNFSCHAIIKVLAPASGYSGFSMAGKVDLTSSPGEVRVKSKINHYNQWEWKQEYIEHSE